MLKARLGSDFDRLVHRVLPFLRKLPIRPDTLTLAGVAISAAVAWAFAVDRWVLAAFLMGFAGLCDLCDGVLARAQGASSRGGAFFDSSMDRVSDLLIFGGILTSFAAKAEVGLVLLTLWALSASVLTSYVRARAEVEIPSLSVGFMERAERFVLLLLGALTGWLVAALWLVALGASITTVQRLVVARREIDAHHPPGVDAEAGVAAPEPAHEPDEEPRVLGAS